MTKVLFQGDSITDVSRVRGNDDNVGWGYALMVKADLGLEKPGAYQFVNRGISGDRIVDVYARIKFDIINVKPDVMSILIGVNDVWHELSCQNGVDADKFYRIYDMLIEEVQEALPNIKIMILEPFTLKGSANEANWDYFRAETEKRAKMAKKIADKHGLTFVPLQVGFDALAENMDPSYWLGDGVHPTAMGHAFIRDRWIEAFKTL